MFCTFANLGVFNLKSQVNTAGKGIDSFYSPKSTSLVKVASLSLISIFDPKEAVGIPRIEPNIYPV